MQKYLKLTKNNSNFKIRYANIQDLNFTLKLHNQNVLKDKFFSKEMVGLKDHKIWFKKKINEKMLFIGTFKDKIGYVRYDFINKKNLSVSIAKLIHEKIKNKQYEIRKLSTENKELYGSVKPTEISKVLEENDQVKINPSLIQPSKEIKSIGNFQVLINLHSEVQTQIVIKTIAQEELK